MLATMLHGLQGTPYIYQGEELGMTNIRLPLEEYSDIEIHNVFAERTAQGYDPEQVMQSIYARGRDNARTPMQWTPGEYAGFSTVKPWLPVNENKAWINAQYALEDPSSVYHYYKTLIALRKQYRVFRDGSFQLLCPEDPQRFIYERENGSEHLLVICNFTRDHAPLNLEPLPEHARLLLSNYPEEGNGLQPYEARMYYWCDR